MVAALVLGTVASTWQAIRATRAERSAKESLQAETEAQSEAAAAATGEKRAARIRRGRRRGPRSRWENHGSKLICSPLYE